MTWPTSPEEAAAVAVREFRRANDPRLPGPVIVIVPVVPNLFIDTADSAGHVPVTDFATAKIRRIGPPSFPRFDTATMQVELAADIARVRAKMETP